MTKVVEVKIDVLDHGYLKPIEHWGSDERIVEAARMSTAKGFLGWGERHETTCPATQPRSENSQFGGACNCAPKPGDEKLLRYLWEHKHATPFEMAGLVIEVQAPIFVFREWHRHRTQCLAGDTMINLVSPRGTTYKRSIADIFTLKHGGVADSAPTRHKNGYSKAHTPVTRAARRTDPWRVRVLPNCQTRVMRTFDEEAHEYRVGVMGEVWESGVKELWSIETSDGVVRASADHPFLTRSGWAKVRDLRAGEMLATSGKVALDERPIPPSLRAGIGVWTTMMRSRLIPPDGADCYLCGRAFARADLDLDHVVPVFADLRRALDESNLRPACKGCHRGKINSEQPSRAGKTRLGLRWTRILRDPVRVAEEMTYDIGMSGPDHNFVANGLVVHNSYNEMSARYVPLPDVNYVPTVERLLINSKTNKQAGAIKGAEELTEKHAEEYQECLRQHYRQDQEMYEYALRAGVPKELARVHLPVGRYSRMRASANLRNWLAFLTLRMDPAAQFEIRQYANAVGQLISERFPRTWELFSGK